MRTTHLSAWVAVTVTETKLTSKICPQDWTAGTGQAGVAFYQHSTSAFYLDDIWNFQHLHSTIWCQNFIISPLTYAVRPRKHILQASYMFAFSSTPSATALERNIKH